MATEWEVWYAGGRRRTSLDGDWHDLPYHGVLVVRAWFENGNGGVVWGDGVYGHPDTWKGGAIVADTEFQQALTDANATVTKPSAR